MYRPKITVITAVYNRVSKIERCISSVINQTYDNIEYIVIDGASTDGTIDVIKKYNNKIAYWCSEPDDGIYDAWNKAIKYATGDYINFIGSDDAMYNSKVVENIVPYLDVDVDVLAGSIMRIGEKNAFERVQTNIDIQNKDNYKGGCITTQGTFIKRSLCNKYKFDTSYKVAADYKFFLQYYYDKTIKIKFVDEIIQYFSDGGISNDDLNFVRNEDNRIYKELGLNELIDCHLADSKYKVREFCKKIGIFDLMQRIYHPYLKGDWKKHHCNNKICRWCGRYES